MNPLIIKIGVGLMASVAAAIWLLIKNKNGRLETQLVAPGNYNGSNIKNCPVCLVEFSELRKNEIITLTCKHKVCVECAIKMFSHQCYNQRTCPNCRQKVDEKIIKQIM